MDPGRVYVVMVVSGSDSLSGSTPMRGMIEEQSAHASTTFTSSDCYHKICCHFPISARKYFFYLRSFGLYTLHSFGVLRG